MSDKSSHYTSATRFDTQKYQRGETKMARIPVKVETTTQFQRKPRWIRAKPQGTPEVQRIKKLLRDNNLHSVCEEAQCPNLGECFGRGTVTFMVMGGICTRRCPFCDVAHGRPDPLDRDEPAKLAQSIRALGLKYVVITSVDRDDLKDGGAGHFGRCIKHIRALNPGICIEVLVPDFRGKVRRAILSFDEALPDVFNHNLETVPRLYRAARPGSNYIESLDLIREFKRRHPDIPTKSGLMLGLGEATQEVKNVIRDLVDHDCNMLTIGQYLQPSPHHMPVSRFVHPDEFKALEEYGYALGFSHVASGPMIRSSYHADLQAKNAM